MPEAGRLPDFVVIGAMKSASSALYEWLQLQPDVFVGRPKEVNFFCDEELWAKGLGWYWGFFEGVTSEQAVGEVSVAYTFQPGADIAAQRMAATIPDARLIFIGRHPLDRLRSHYRHEVQRGRESRTLADALAEPDAIYVTRSLYHTMLAPFYARTPREQILFVRFDDLVTPPHRAWDAIIDHIGLPRRPAPALAFNVTAEKPQWTRLFRFLGRMTSLRKLMPAPVRHVGTRLLTRRGGRYERLIASASESLPADVTGRIWDDISRLEARLDADGQLWPRSPSSPMDAQVRSPA